jgi:hypothetical protein
MVGNDIEQPITLPLIVYHNIQELIDMLNLLIPPNTKGQKPVQFENNSLKKTVKINIDPTSIIKISDKLSYILGFNGTLEFRGNESNLAQLTAARTTFHSTVSSNLLAGAYHMFIYSDIIQPQVVGSELVPLFRIINLTENDNKVTTTRFVNPYYLPLARNIFDTISVVLCNEFGEELFIDKGQVTLTLHFRKNVP